MSKEKDMTAPCKPCEMAARIELLRDDLLELGPEFEHLASIVNACLDDDEE